MKQKSHQSSKPHKSTKSRSLVKSRKATKSKSTLPVPNFTYDPAKLENLLKIDAKGLGLHPGAADDFVDRVVTTVSRQVSAGKILTKRELKSTIVRELKKYHRDFAYIFQNRDKIV